MSLISNLIEFHRPLPSFYTEIECKQASFTSGPNSPAGTTPGSSANPVGKPPISPTSSFSTRLLTSLSSTSSGLQKSSPSSQSGSPFSISPSTSSVITVISGTSSSSNTTIKDESVSKDDKIKSPKKSYSVDLQSVAQASSSSSYHSPSRKPKLSPSKRLDTFDHPSGPPVTSNLTQSKSRESKGSPAKKETSSLKNRRRRRSLSLCESFSDGESTDGKKLNEENTMTIKDFRRKRFRSKVYAFEYSSCQGFLIYFSDKDEPYSLYLNFHAGFMQDSCTNKHVHRHRIPCR